MLNWIFTMSDASAFITSETVAPAADVSGGLASLPLLSKGFLTTGMGLFGVFLVLALFFVTIKAMQGIKAKDGDN